MVYQWNWGFLKMRFSRSFGTAIWILISFVSITKITPALAEDHLATRLAGASFKVVDLEKARQFYTVILGLEEAFDLKDSNGVVQSSFFKVNDDQYLEFSSGALEKFQLEHVSILSADLKKSAALLSKQGIIAGKIMRSGEGNRFFAIKDPDQVEIDFVQYMPGSQQLEHRGKSKSNPISDHLQHVGLAPSDNDATLAFYRDKLGFQQFSVINSINGHVMLPGSSGDAIELMTTLTDPVLIRQHISFAVPDIHRAYDLLRARGLQGSAEPFPAKVGHWMWNLRDPNGLRIEISGEPDGATQQEK
jgi:catechol 2,3-dioxygenase-like lactoylglutathione lyase family enzyme